MPDIEAILERYEDAKAARTTFESHWQEVADLVRPDVPFTTRPTPGQKNRYRIYDDTAVNAHDELAANLDATLTNSQIRWMALVPVDPSINVDEDDEVDRWLYHATSVMLRFFESPESGFALASHESYLDLTTWGTSCLSIEDRDGIPRFSSKAMSGIYLDGNDSNEVTAVYRCFEDKGRYLKAKFKELPEKMAKIVARDGATKLKVLHAVMAREERDATKIDAMNKPWASLYICEETKELIREGGFDWMPLLTPRWEVAPGEIYGRSPAMRALPSIKAINAMAKMTLEATELTIRPPLMVHANGTEGNLSTLPGSINYIKAGTREFPTPMQHGARPDFGEAEIERRAKGIREAFYVDRLRLPEQDRMTATEIVARQRQGLLVFSPILGRMYAEKLNPIVQITYAMLVAKKMIPPPPAKLASKPLAVAYMSPLASSRGSAQLDAAMQTIGTVLPLGPVDPSAFDAIDFDKLVRIVARASSLDPTALKRASEVKQIRDQRMQAMQAQATAEIAATGAKAAKDMGMTTGAANVR